MTTWCAKLASDLTVLRDLTGEGAERYRPADPLDEGVVAAFEARHGVSLPADYRAFLLEVGDGGIGPDYGIKPLADYQPAAGLPQVTTTITMKDGSTISAGTGPREVPARTAVLGQPFVVREAWAPVDEDGRATPLPVPADAHPYDGTLELAEIGCGYFHLLVVTGEDRGAVWVDYTAGDGSLAPSAPSFRDWLRGWLDRELIGAFGQAARQALAGEAELPPRSLLEAGFERIGALAGARDTDADAQAAHAMLALCLGRREAAAAAIERLAAIDPTSTWLGELSRYYHADQVAQAEAQPPVDAEALARHPAYEVRIALAANRTAPAAALALLADAPEPSIWSYLAENPAAPAAVIEHVVTRLCQAFDAAPDDPRPLVFLELALRRDDAPAELVARVVTWTGLRAGENRALAIVLRGAALAPGAPAALLGDLAANPWPEVRHGIARNPITSAELLEALAGDADPFVRAGVAIRRDARPELLAGLAGDLHPAVRHNVARNPSTPISTLRRMACADDPDLSYYLLRNPALPNDLVALIEAGPNGDERDEVDSPEGPGDELDIADLPSSATARAALDTGAVRHHAYPVVMLMAARGGHMATYNMSSRPWLTAELFEALASDPYAYTRMTLAARVDTPRALLERLATDPEDMVRAPAARRLSAS
jgi:hypothetical protein